MGSTQNTKPSKRVYNTYVEKYKKLKDAAYRVASRLFGDSKYSPAIQNDWQRLLDAMDSRDKKKLNKLRVKYQKDEGLDGLGAGASGAGPAKVRQARMGAAQIARFAREAASLLSR